MTANKSIPPLSDFDKGNFVEWLRQPYEASAVSDDFNTLQERKLMRDLALATLVFGANTKSEAGAEHVHREWVMEYDGQAKVVLQQDLTYAGAYPAKDGISTEYNIRVQNMHGDDLLSGRESRIYDFGALSPEMSSASLFTLRKPEQLQRLRDDIFKANPRQRAGNLTIA